MRPIKLTMTAFGPYKDVEIVDFTKLENRNLFLITGPTGSGKTTIFDAISFAIYGEVSGDMRTAESLRSQFSDVKLLTEVELEFELKGIKYHIHRIPKQSKPKARGEGFTDQKPEAVLTIYNGEPKTIVSGVKNVNDKIESIIGINAEQFKQIMMIPQGEFQKLLTSNSEDRQRVLQQLFDTSIYNTIQMKLEMQSKSLYGEIKRKKEIRDYEISKIESLDHEELHRLIEAEDKLIDEIMRLTKVRVKNDQQIRCDLENEVKKLGNKIEKEIEARQRAKEDNEKLKLKDIIKGKVEEKELLSNDMIKLNNCLKSAQRAQVIVPIEENYRLREIDFKNKEKEFIEVTDKKNQAKINAKEAEIIYLKESSPEMINKRNLYIEEISRMRSFVEKVERIEAIRLSINKAENLFEKIERDKDTNSNFIISSNKSLEELHIKSNQAKDAEVRAGVKREELNKLIDIENKLKKVSDLKTKLINEEKNYNKQELILKELEKKVKIYDEKYKESKLEFLMNQAAVLAKELKEGNPCPVCGSRHHEELAVFSKNTVTEEELDKLERTVKEYEVDYNAKNREIGIIEERINKLNASYIEFIEELSLILSFQMEDMLSSDHLEYLTKLIENNISKSTELELELKSLELLARTYEKIMKDISKKSIEIKNAEEKNILLLEKYMKTSNLLSEEKTKLNNIYIDVPDKFRNSIKLSEKIKDLEKLQVESNKRLDHARKYYDETKNIFVVLEAHEKQLSKDLKVTSDSVENAKKVLDAKIIESEFIDYADYKNSKLSQEVMDGYQKELEQYSKELHSLKQQLEELTQQTKNIQEMELIVFDKQIDKLRIENTELMNKKGATINRITNNSRILNEIERINAEIGDKETVYRVIGNLASVAKGNNPSRITFERYVLAAFLEDIIVAANVRLYQMTGGRYKLSRTEELQRSNAKGGLELEVLDGFTGKSRHVKTLSGGEGFKASLSMALGLADVVQSYAGGVQLDTMFIDEGFGTLDQESLDSAISCLIELQKTGRMVGIIS
ncbi:MAG: AAA family ATPase, partial [Eubacteriaceae bacterium]